MRPLDRQILRLAVPALGALVAEPLYVLADTAIVGRVLGTDALAGLAVASSILLLGYSVFIFLAYGTTAAVSRLIGAGDERQAAHQAVQGLWLALGLGLVVATATAALSDPLLRLMGADGEVLAQATIYLRISLLGVPAMMIVLAGTGYLRGLQDTRTPLLVAAGSAALNLLLGLWWIVVLDLGIGASALSTVVAQWASAGVYVTWVAVAVRRHTVPLGPRPRTLSRSSPSSAATSSCAPRRCGGRSCSPPPSPPGSARPTWPPTRWPSRSGACSPSRSTPWPSPVRR